MSKPFFLCLSFVLLSVSSSAAIYKGQDVYMKKCRKCHTNVHEMTASKDWFDWDQLMLSNGKGLADLHLSSTKAEKSWPYFESTRYMKNAGHLRDFLVEYAKDSGKVPVSD